VGGVFGIVVDEVGRADQELAPGESVTLGIGWLGLPPELGLPWVTLGEVPDGTVDPAVVEGEMTVVVVGGGVAAQISA
jgi:hypothetical protein